MELLHSIFSVSPLLRLFVIIGIGYLVGEIKLGGGFRLGVAAVLFVGLGLGALSPDYALPHELGMLGLVLFVYCLGLEAAPNFIQTFKRNGLKPNIAVFVVLCVVAVLIWLFSYWQNFSSSLMSGVFCGAVTNTAALASVSELIMRTTTHKQFASMVVIGYGLAYPFAIFVTLSLFQILIVLKKEQPKEATIVNPYTPPHVILIQKKKPDGNFWTPQTIQREFNLIVTRIKLPGGVRTLAQDEMELPVGTVAVVVGKDAHVHKALPHLGSFAEDTLDTEMEGFQAHRYFVSNPKIVGVPIQSLRLDRKGIIITRVRRGDTDLPVTDDLMLQLGDRVRAVTYSEKEPEVRKFFGNSLQSLTETGYLSFGLGIAFGLLLGQVPIPIPGIPEPIHLGVAGGPLIVALILGRLGRTGPLIWNMPLSANFALRQLGILLFLATVGTKAGQGFIDILINSGLSLILGTVSIVTLGHILLFFCLRILGERSVPRILGVASAYQTQPAALAFAESRVDRMQLTEAYASVYPLALILKIILAQLIFIFLA
jgi:putative transport protein